MFLQCRSVNFHPVRSVAEADVASRVAGRIRIGRRPSLLIAVALSLCTGCSPKAEIQQYVVEPENDRIITSDVLRDEFGAIPFQWNVPESWAMAANDQFSKVAWTVGAKGEEARITVSDLPISAGLVPQLTRWRRQVGIKSDPKDDPMLGTEKMKLDGGSATYVDISGDEQAILGLIVPEGSKLWVFKLRGSNAVARQQEKQFRTFCESMKIPATQEGK